MNIKELFYLGLIILMCASFAAGVSCSYFGTGVKAFVDICFTVNVILIGVIFAPAWIGWFVCTLIKGGK